MIDKASAWKTEMMKTMAKNLEILLAREDMWTKRLEREARLREIKELELKQAHEMYKAELESLK